MKKIAFMFAAAALFAACTETQKPATEATEAVDSTATVVETIDSAAVWALVGDTTGMDADTLAAKFECALAQMKAECCQKDSACCDSAKVAE